MRQMWKHSFHSSDQCWDKEKICYKCHEKGHIAKRCPHRVKQQTSEQRQSSRLQIDTSGRQPIKDRNGLHDTQKGKPEKQPQHKPHQDNITTTKHFKLPRSNPTPDTTSQVVRRKERHGSSVVYVDPTSGVRDRSDPPKKPGPKNDLQLKHKLPKDLEEQKRDLKEWSVLTTRVMTTEAEIKAVDARLKKAETNAQPQIQDCEIEKIHRSLQTCPSADIETDGPKGLKVTLMTHQRQALTWLIWREQQHPCGGILADDMGLGKTLTMISLTLKQKQQAALQDQPEKDTKPKDQQDFITSQGTLVVCPASLMVQWNKEVEKRCAPGSLKLYSYHGENREKNPKTLGEYDMVFTTYSIVSKELSAKDKGEHPVEDLPSGSDQPTLLKICWERIILDEAHSIKNYKSQTSMAICRLRARARWAVTGTPIQNNLKDMFSLMRYLRCSPFDEYEVWKRQVDNNSESGNNLLNILVKNLQLRRTKDQKNATTGKPLVALPDKKIHVHEIELSPNERRVYDKVFGDSKSKMQDHIHFLEDKEKGQGSSRAASMGAASAGRASGGSRTMQMEEAVSGTHVLVSLLRLRQCCGHLSLLKEAVDTKSCELEGIDLDLVGQMKEMNIDDGEAEDDLNGVDSSSTKTSIFDKRVASTKIQFVLSALRDIRRDSPPGRPMKSVIISQWTQMLDIMADHLTRAGYRFWSICGNVPPKKRGEAMEDFNSNPRGPEVMLVSLRAGGVGLNLLGGNHLFLLDMHWNPALEDQACDRIHRLGQEKDVSIHKFVCKDTIEMRIQELQKRKSKLATDVLSGARSQSKNLSLADLRYLSDMN